MSIQTHHVRAATELRIAVGRLVRRMREVSSTVTPAQASVIARLAKGEATSAALLAQIENVRPQSMAATVSALESTGLLSRTPDPADGRRQLLTLTDAGRDVAEGNRDARHEWLESTVAERLSDEDCRILIQAATVIDTLVR